MNTHYPATSWLGGLLMAGIASISFGQVPAASSPTAEVVAVTQPKGHEACRLGATVTFALRSSSDYFPYADLASVQADPQGKLLAEGAVERMVAPELTRLMKACGVWYMQYRVQVNGASRWEGMVDENPKNSRRTAASYEFKSALDEIKNAAASRANAEREAAAVQVRMRPDGSGLSVFRRVECDGAVQEPRGKAAPTARDICEALWDVDYAKAYETLMPSDVTCAKPDPKQVVECRYSYRADYDPDKHALVDAGVARYVRLARGISNLGSQGNPGELGAAILASINPSNTHRWVKADSPNFSIPRRFRYNQSSRRWVVDP